MLELIQNGGVTEPHNLIFISNKSYNTLNRNWVTIKKYSLTDNVLYYFSGNKKINNTLQSKIIYRKYRKELKKKNIKAKNLISKVLFNNLGSI